MFISLTVVHLYAVVLYNLTIHCHPQNTGSNLSLVPRSLPQGFFLQRCLICFAYYGCKSVCEFLLSCFVMSIAKSDLQIKSN